MTNDQDKDACHNHPTANNSFRGWKDELQSIISKNNKLRVNGKVASNKTQHERAKFLFLFFHWLRKNGYHIAPHNLKERHVQAYCSYMAEKGLAPATIQSYFSMLKAFCLWIHKPGLLGQLKNYYLDKKIHTRTYAAAFDKSWTGNDVDVNQVLGKIKNDSRFVFVQLLMVSAFGLRRKEAICLRPAMSILSNGLNVTEGTKGGKCRVVPIENDHQRCALNEALKLTGISSKNLGDPDLTLKQNLIRYTNMLVKHGITRKELGVTGHGLRVEYIVNFMESQGLIAQVRGGNTEENRLDPILEQKKFY